MTQEPLSRCPWGEGNSLERAYHDLEWGTPVHDDRKLYEFLVLEGAQAGLSWDTILRKRENYRQAFDQFDPVRVAQYTDGDVQRLLADAGIVRNRLKIASAINNARCLLQVQQEFGTYDAYLWQFTGGKSVLNTFTAMSEIPAHTAQSDAMSKDMRKRGFNFVGSTICYAMMQAVGMVNDHLITCFRHAQV
ncbi:MAG TPA: DNA-3-methyladenine glycosylase I [Anaerolineae bacterium]